MVSTLYEMEPFVVIVSEGRTVYLKEKLLQQRLETLAAKSKFILTI